MTAGLSNSVATRFSAAPGAIYAGLGLAGGGGPDSPLAEADMMSLDELVLRRFLRNVGCSVSFRTDLVAIFDQSGPVKEANGKICAGDNFLQRHANCKLCCIQKFGFFQILRCSLFRIVCQYPESLPVIAPSENDEFRGARVAIIVVEPFRSVSVKRYCQGQGLAMSRVFQEMVVVCSNVLDDSVEVGNNRRDE